jgi:hypothetical protein
LRVAVDGLILMMGENLVEMAAELG